MCFSSLQIELVGLPRKGSKEQKMPLPLDLPHLRKKKKKKGVFILLFIFIVYLKTEALINLYLNLPFSFRGKPGPLFSTLEPVPKWNFSVQVPKECLMYF